MSAQKKSVSDRAPSPPPKDASTAHTVSGTSKLPSILEVTQVGLDQFTGPESDRNDSRKQANKSSHNEPSEILESVAENTLQYQQSPEPSEEKIQTESAVTVESSNEVTRSFQTQQLPIAQTEVPISEPDRLESGNPDAPILLTKVHPVQTSSPVTTPSTAVSPSAEIAASTAPSVSGAPVKPRRKKLSKRRVGAKFSAESTDSMSAEIDKLFSICDEDDSVDHAHNNNMSNEILVEEWLMSYVNQWVESGKKRARTTPPLSVRITQYSEKLLTQKTVKASGFVLLKNTKRKKVHQLNNFVNNVAYTLALWGKSIRVIEGHHGAGVASYFLFLRWLFGLNIFLYILMLSFIILPMSMVDSIALAPSTDTDYNTSYYCSLNYTVVEGSGVSYLLEFVQGTGWMEKTLVFYGYYVVDLDVSYNLPLAYVLTAIACLVVSMGLMAIYTGKSFKEALLNAANSNFEYSNKVFGAWDFALTDPEAADLKMKGIHYDLQSDMLEQTFMRKRIERLENRCSTCKLYFIRLLVNFLIVVSLGGAAYLIFYVTSFSTEYASEHKDMSGIDSWLLLLVQYLPSITITACNAALPFIFEKIVGAEDYSQSFVIKITLIRTVFLRLASMIVLVITLYTEVSCTPQDSCKATVAPDCTEIKCWESYIGQQFYKLVITDFLVAVVKVFAVELPRKKLYDRCQCGLMQKIGPPEFNIPSNVLDLVYGQCLVCLGLLFSPMLPGMVVIKCFILFYVKKISALVACPPAERPYKASRINTFFMAILLLAYFLCALPVIFSIFGIHPSRSCGPFRVYDYMEDAIEKTVESWPSVLSKSYDLITSTAVTGTIIILLCMALYYLKTMSAAHKQQAELFKEQLIMEGRDKQFLLTKLQDIYISSEKKNQPAHKKKHPKDKKKDPPRDSITNVNENKYKKNADHPAVVSPPNAVDSGW